MSVKPILKKFTHSEQSSLDLSRSDIHGLGLNVPDYNGPGARSSLSDGVGNVRHYRSTSTETTASGKKFIHPFAQSPRPYTPPIGQANLQRENEFAREDMAINEEDFFPPRSESNLSSRRPQVNNILPAPAPLRIQTSRRAYGNHSGSQTNLQSPLTLHSTDHLSMSPSSVRSSIDRALPRVRSRSDISAISQADAVRNARRQFAEREAAKDLKYAEEEKKAMEKQAAREERKHGRKSATVSEEGRTKRSRSDVNATQDEKTGGIHGTDYNSSTCAAHATDSSGSDSHNQRRRAARSTKKKTHSLWTEFVLWLRTRLFKLARRASRH